jgi:hypothetical protein
MVQYIIMNGRHLKMAIIHGRGAGILFRLISSVERIVFVIFRKILNWTSSLPVEGDNGSDADKRLSQTDSLSTDPFRSRLRVETEA